MKNNTLTVFKKYLPFFVCLFFAATINAQIKHAIYIQTEDKKPFYITANGETKNSTESGYIILPQITDSLYSLVVGSPTNDFPDQKFVVNMNNDDWEFTFRKNDNNEYELFDMIHSTALNIYKTPEAQPAETLAAQAPEQETVQQQPTENVAAVTVTETNAAQDTVQQQPVEQAQILNKQKVAANKPNNNISKNNNLKNTQNKVNKIFERVSAQGVDLIYVDERKPKFDTIAIFIAAAKNAETGRPAKKVSQPVVKPKPVKVTPTPEQKSAAIIDTVTTVAQQNVAAKNSTVAAKRHCTDIANNDDFLSLRKRLAALNSEEDMLVIAQKKFEEKCYSVNQIKNLSVLFLDEKNKFSFFELAKPATSDNANFYKLINQLTQPDLLEKFAALIQQQ